MVCHTCHSRDATPRVHVLTMDSRRNLCSLAVPPMVGDIPKLALRTRALNMMHTVTAVQHHSNAQPYHHLWVYHAHPSVTAATSVSDTQ